jgi:transposase InsO family protein
MPASVEALVLEMRRVHRFWGPRRIVFELAKKQVEPMPSESGVYRCLVRAGLIEPSGRRRRGEKWKRWERGQPMELWQMDVVGGFLLADGSTAKALTGVDDHSRFCVSARLMPREQTRAVCEGLAAALSSYGVPSQILTDNGKVFTGRFNQPPVEVLFDKICRQNGVDHLLTAPRSPTTTGKIERFHRSLRAEFDTKQIFRSLKAAQGALDEWVEYYNTERPHQSLSMATPADRFTTVDQDTSVPAGAADTRPVDTAALSADRTGQGWVSRRVCANGVVSVAWQQVSVGKHRAGENCDVFVTDQLLQFWVGDELLKTVTRTSTGEVRKKRASVRRKPD